MKMLHKLREFYKKSLLNSFCLEKRIKKYTFYLISENNLPLIKQNALTQTRIQLLQ